MFLNLPLDPQNETTKNHVPLASVVTKLADHICCSLLFLAVFDFKRSESNGINENRQIQSLQSREQLSNSTLFSPPIHRWVRNCAAKINGAKLAIVVDMAFDEG